MHPEDETQAGAGRAFYGSFLSGVAPRLANGILAAVFCAIGLTAFISVLLTGPNAAEIASSFAYLIALLSLQLGYFSRPRVRFRPSVTYPALAAQAALVYLPVLQFGESWIGLPGLLAGSVLLVFQPPVSMPLFLTVVASMGWLGALSGRGPLQIAHLVISATITGLVVYGLTRLARLVAQLHAARDEMARLAVAEERLRFARDVHDVLGLSLSAITLKSELANRLITDHPERARDEVMEILETSRKALADARSVASGYRQLSFDEECRSARSVLAAADVDVRIRYDGYQLTGPPGRALSAVLREGVTNVLRHSKAEWCVVDVRRVGDEVRMDIVNDGAAREGEEILDQGEGGSGLRNLSGRVRDLGGELETSTQPDGTYRLRVTIPLDEAS